MSPGCGGTVAAEDRVAGYTRAMPAGRPAVRRPGRRRRLQRPLGHGRGGDAARPRRRRDLLRQRCDRAGRPRDDPGARPAGPRGRRPRGLRRPRVLVPPRPAPHDRPPGRARAGRGGGPVPCSSSWGTPTPNAAARPAPDRACHSPVDSRRWDTQPDDTRASASARGNTSRSTQEELRQWHTPDGSPALLAIAGIVVSAVRVVHPDDRPRERRGRRGLAGPGGHRPRTDAGLLPRRPPSRSTRARRRCTPPARCGARRPRRPTTRSTRTPRWGRWGSSTSPLFHYDPLADKFTPWLAESGDLDRPDLYTVKLRPGVTWTDGAADGG